MPGREIVLAQPSGYERRQGQPEQQMQIRPQHATIDVLDCLQQVMMIAPIDAYKNKTQQVTEKHWGNGNQRLPTGDMRHLQLQNHDGDNNRNHAIAECFQSALGHGRVTSADKSFFIGTNPIVASPPTSSSTRSLPS